MILWKIQQQTDMDLYKIIKRKVKKLKAENLWEN